MDLDEIIKENEELCILIANGNYTKALQILQNYPDCYIDGEKLYLPDEESFRYQILRGQLFETFLYGQKRAHERKRRIIYNTRELLEQFENDTLTTQEYCLKIQSMMDR